MTEINIKQVLDDMEASIKVGDIDRFVALDKHASSFSVDSVQFFLDLAWLNYCAGRNERAFEILLSLVRLGRHEIIIFVQLMFYALKEKKIVEALALFSSDVIRVQFSIKELNSALSWLDRFQCLFICLVLE